MARPTKTKELKGRGDASAKPTALPGGGGGGDGGGGNAMITTIIAAVAAGLISASVSAAAVYFLVPMVVNPIVDQAVVRIAGDEAGAHGEDELPAVGPVIDLDEFTLNLSDPDKTRYLRADLSITITPNDEDFGKLTGEAAHAWEENFHHHISHYVPAIRDIVIATLTKHTAGELSTNEGKESVKEEISEKVDEVFHGDHQVIRVNIENFIIQ
ncbi:MAG: flagellar basal body-associated FliL family protein [Cyanobacteria bacterium HKST-UBA06]|nr:flagellar basal body-associated FliL family protein [Cyanobacteria bacterium HKST-UBA04]MCA9806708.1 flagellar basal body-associated FliL family protein [Cyanobacteria bacterium HKST-UBA06]MCA9840783.1 flagellar basal body-associated FliL family protein [Cyanobacteria bacterium HKST-UBA03]